MAMPMEDALALVGAVGGDVGELRMPSARHTLRHPHQQFLLIVRRDEGGQLEDILLEHLVQRRSLCEFVDSQHPMEDALDVARWVKHRHILPTNHNQAVTLCLRILHTSHHILLGDGLVTHQLVTHIAQSAVGGDIPVDEMFDGSAPGWWTRESHAS